MGQAGTGPFESGKGDGVRERITALTGMIAVGCAMAWFAVLARPGSVRATASVAAAAPSVRAVYQRDCATCHGADARGTRLGPELRGVGAAMVDFQLSTGRMPVPTGDAAQHEQRPSAALAQARRTPKYDDATRHALTDYVTNLAGGIGPAIPRVHADAGNLAAGGTTFRLQCAACHAWSGDGGALLQREAPSTHPATPVEIAEAVRTGPGNMPAFGRAAVSNAQLQSLVRYVRYLDHADDRGGDPLWHLGPLAEGAVAVFVGLGLLVLAVRWIGTRS
jgi:ubiquinol-cytochrome c reductase cytochrome c subunit